MLKIVITLIRGWKMYYLHSLTYVWLQISFYALNLIYEISDVVCFDLICCWICHMLFK